MWKTLADTEKIIAILQGLVSHGTELKVLIGVEENEFVSRVIKVDTGDPVSMPLKKPNLIVEKIVPEAGNALLKTSPDLVLEFPLGRSLCRCASRFLGISSEGPHYGLILSVPREVEFQDRRREERYVYEMPDFVSVEFHLKKGEKKGKVYSLNVYDCSLHGLGILITKRDFDLVRILKPGDELKEISFYAESSLIRVDGIVRHLTKISSGKHQGSYILGIESPEIIESSRAPKREQESA